MIEASCSPSDAESSAPAWGRGSFMPRSWSRQPAPECGRHGAQSTRPESSGTNTTGARLAWSTTPSASLRSEEHTSELQSLMRISYAVFCLKKKKKHHKKTCAINTLTNNVIQTTQERS